MIWCLLGTGLQPLPAQTSITSPQTPTPPVASAPPTDGNEALRPSASLGLPAPAPEPAVVNGDNVIVRKQPTIKSELVTHLNRGDRVLVLEDIARQYPMPNEPNQWCRVTLPAWISARYLDPATQRITASRLNVRSGPGVDYRIVSLLQKGDAVKAAESQGEWIRIDMPSPTLGFIAAHLLTRQPPAPPPAVVTSPPRKSPAPVTPKVVAPAVATSPAPVPALVPTKSPPTAKAEGLPVTPVLPEEAPSLPEKASPPPEHHTPLVEKTAPSPSLPENSTAEPPPPTNAATITAVAPEPKPVNLDTNPPPTAAPPPAPATPPTIVETPAEPVPTPPAPPPSTTRPIPEPEPVAAKPPEQSVTEIPAPMPPPAEAAVSALPNVTPPPTTSLPEMPAEEPTLSPEQEQKARALLEKTLAEMSPQSPAKSEPKLSREAEPKVDLKLSQDQQEGKPKQTPPQAEPVGRAPKTKAGPPDQIASPPPPIVPPAAPEITSLPVPTAPPPPVRLTPDTESPELPPIRSTVAAPAPAAPPIGAATLLELSAEPEPMTVEQEQAARELLNQVLTASPAPNVAPPKPAEASAPKQTGKQNQAEPAAETGARQQQKSEALAREEPAIKRATDAEAQARREREKAEAEALIKSRQAERQRRDDTAPQTSDSKISPLTPSKHDRLERLTQDYVNDKLTPDEYYRQRSKILAEP